MNYNKHIVCDDFESLTKELCTLSEYWIGKYKYLYEMEKYTHLLACRLNINLEDLDFIKLEKGILYFEINNEPAYNIAMLSELDSLKKIT